MSEYKYSILTVNFGKYEILLDPKEPRDDVEYVCVTDDPDLKSDVWKIIYKPGMWFLYPKHNPYEFVSTDVCLWLDGSYYLCGDPTDNLVMPFINSDKEMMISLHNYRHNVYEELVYWMYTRGLDPENANAMFTELVSNGFNSDTLFQTSCILTKKTPIIQLIFSEVNALDKKCSVKGNYRDDQTIISYVIASKFPNWSKIVLMDFKYTNSNPYFYRRFHGTMDRMPEESYSFRCFNVDQQMLYCIK